MDRPRRDPRRRCAPAWPPSATSTGSTAATRPCSPPSSRGRRLGLPAVAMTFDPHPVAVLRPEQAPELITPGRCATSSSPTPASTGCSSSTSPPSSPSRPPEDFVRAVFVRGLDARCVVVGDGHPASATATPATSAPCADLGEQFGFEVIALDDVGDGERYSSTASAGRLRAGEVGEAARILGRPHRVVGTVVHGNHRGRGLGLPDRQPRPDSLGLVPAEGVYAGWLTRLDVAEGEPDRTMPAAISVGTNPTFDTHDRRTVEAYVLDRDDLDLYDETGHGRVRRRTSGPTLRFESVEELHGGDGRGRRAVPRGAGQDRSRLSGPPAPAAARACGEPLGPARRRPVRRRRRRLAGRCPARLVGHGPHDGHGLPRAPPRHGRAGPRGLAAARHPGRPQRVRAAAPWAGSAAVAAPAAAS